MEVGTLESIKVCNLLNFESELSKTRMLAPNPPAALVANSPTIPAPIITTSVGLTPVIPPNIKPLDKAKSSEAYKIELSETFISELINN